MGICMGKSAIKRIVMVGLDNAGKTTLLYRMKINKVLPTIPTIGFNAEQVEVAGVTVVIWDLGGQLKIRSMWEHYMKDATGLVFVLDSSDVSRLTEAREELARVLQLPDVANCRAVLILANKQDEKSALKADAITQHLNLSPVLSSPRNSASLKDSSRQQQQQQQQQQQENSNPAEAVAPASPAPAINSTSNSSHGGGNHRSSSSSGSFGEKLSDTGLLAGKPWHVQECCALTGAGIMDGLSWLLKHSETA